MFPKKGNVFPAPSGHQGSEVNYPVVVAMALRQNCYADYMNDTTMSDA